ncbi:hypothetical protein AB0C02_30540 [Micromonospora sp. NPDC048999]|uniref:hypothetical protein n=1 Tax=Micromonospora sp. NPDC048999 TaxID=3155391 RepID=UPI0033CD78C1
MIVALVDHAIAYPGMYAAAVLAAVCAGLLARIALLLYADRYDRWVRVVGVAAAPPTPPARAYSTRPRVNPLFVAYVAARSAEHVAACRAGGPVPHVRTGDTPR